MEPASEVAWVSRRAAAKALGTSKNIVDRLIACGRLSVRRVPGSFTRVDLAEVTALAEASTTRRVTP